MSFVSAQQVEEAAALGRLALAPGERLTPLAAELAEELGVQIIAAAAAPADSGRSGRGPGGADPPRISLAGPGALTEPPSPALFRRGAPYPGLLGRGPAAPAPASCRNGEPPSSRIRRVVVVGAGNVGTHAAMRLAETDLIDEIVLVDIREGTAAGVALDLQHAAGLLGFRTVIRGAADVAAAGPAEYTIITAGRPRTPGMSRTDLTAANAAIVGPVARASAETSPEGVILVVTNPLDEMTELAWTASGLPSERVIGMAGLLDSARFQALAGLAAARRPDDVSGIALGSHGEEMVVPPSQATIGGSRAGDILGDRLGPIVDRTRDSGAEVVGLLGTGSAFITPGLAAARMVEWMIRGSERLVAATVRAGGQYGISGVYVGLPVRLGRAGLERIVEVPLEPEEVRALRSAAEEIRTRVAGLETVA